MLEAVVEHASLWKNVVDCLSLISKSVNFDCTPGGITIQAMDTTRIALVNLQLRDDCFQKYQCERNTILGLNLESMSKILKLVNGTDTLTLRHDEDSDYAVLTSVSSDKMRRCEYQVRLLDVEMDSYSLLENEDHVGCIKMSSAEFSKTMKDLMVIGSTVTIHLTKEGVKFSTTGEIGSAFTFLQADSSSGNRGSVKAEVKAEPKADEEASDENMARKFSKLEKNACVDISVGDPVDMSFSLQHLNNFARGASLSDTVKLLFYTEFPCVVEFSIDNVGHLRYYLAPQAEG